MSESDGSNPSTGISTTTDISGTTGDVIGSTTSGMANIIGKDVVYSVSGSVINLHVESISAETLQQLKDILSQSMQLETKGFRDEQRNTTNTEFANARANEARTTKKQINQVINEIDDIGKQTGTHIEQIRAGEIQVSRTELLLKDIIAEGIQHFWTGDYSKAIECYDRALKIDEKFATAWFRKGLALHMLGRYDEAIQCCYDEALKIDGKYVDAWFRKGLDLHMLGRYDEAIQCYDEALKIDSKHVDAWFRKGSTFEKLGEYEEAIQCYDEILKIDGKHTKAWNNKGVTLDKLGKHEEAKKCYVRAKQLG